MAETDAPLLHVGFPKTGSTWLQRELFCDTSLGFCEPWDDVRARLVAEFIVTDAYRFDPGRAARSFEAGLRSAAGDGRVPVLSEETLCGDPLQRRYDGRAVAERLRQTFPGARVLICVREQREMLRSLYHEYVRHGGVLSLLQFVGTGHEPRSFTPICRLDYLEYDQVVRWYQEGFGADRVLVLPFEWLRADQAAFAQRILEFAGTGTHYAGRRPPRNPGWSAATLPVARRLHRLTPRDPLGPRQSRSFEGVHRALAVLDRWLPGVLHDWADARERERIASRVKDHFAASNRRLGGLIGLDLEPLGYPVAGSS